MSSLNYQALINQTYLTKINLLNKNDNLNNEID